MQRRDADNCRDAGRYGSLHTAKRGQRHVPADLPLELVKISRSGAYRSRQSAVSQSRARRKCLRRGQRDQASRSRQKSRGGG
jgi:hypothetical protein